MIFGLLPQNPESKAVAVAKSSDGHRSGGHLRLWVNWKLPEGVEPHAHDLRPVLPQVKDRHISAGQEAISCVRGASGSIPGLE